MDYSLDELINHPDLSLAHRVRGVISSEDNRPAPCLVLLHGVGANEVNLAALAQQQDPRLVVILARGPIAFGPMQFGWFNVNFTADGPKIHAAQAEQSRTALVDFIDRLPAVYNIDPERVWIAGFSQGGIMSAGVGLTRPDKVVGFGILSGRILPEIAPLTAPNEQTRKLAAFISHGVADGKLAVEFARHAQRLLHEKEVNLTYREYEAVHELNADMQRDFDEWMTRQIDGEQA